MHQLHPKQVVILLILMVRGELGKADLIVGTVYAGDSHSISDDPISRLLPGVGNSGGIRPAGKGKDKKYVALYSTGKFKFQEISPRNGQFLYLGDNNQPGQGLLAPRGNKTLKQTFDDLHSSRRSRIPPYFFFKKSTANGVLAVEFKGLAAFGFAGRYGGKLVTHWEKSPEREYFQNYMACFTVLNVRKIKRDWLDALASNDPASMDKAPKVWSDWIRTGHYEPLID